MATCKTLNLGKVKKSSNLLLVKAGVNLEIKMRKTVK
jgi:hypothetical protein